MEGVQVLDLLCGAAEYDEMPVRHNEDKLNAQMLQQVRWPLKNLTPDDPHLKANLLLQVPACWMLSSCLADC